MRYRLWPRCSIQVAELLLLHAGKTVPSQRIEAMAEALLRGERDIVFEDIKPMATPITPAQDTQ